ncbi:hypothetical protein [Actinoplanes sp. NPDC051494]|uniref:hypothetical protein n=1 Tax=Actinoplanes sp. NPDC051494 TaxID=3363907 RepID=UPI0037952788
MTFPDPTFDNHPSYESTPPPPAPAPTPPAPPAAQPPAYPGRPPAQRAYQPPIEDAEEAARAQRVQRAAQDAEAQTRARRDIGFGAVWLLAGIIITLWTLSSGATFYIVAWGPMLYGAYRLIKGLVTRNRTPS